MHELAYDEVNGAFRIIHISIQKTHIHLLVEADNKLALSRGMQSFMISAAKHINRAYSEKMKLAKRRRGPVFTIAIIKKSSRRRARLVTRSRTCSTTGASIAKIASGSRRTWKVDPFSTGFNFMGWRERADEMVHWRGRDTYDPLVVYFPKTWLLGQGWRKAGNDFVLRSTERPTIAGATRHAAAIDYLSVDHYAMVMDSHVPLPGRWRG